jgi:predicted DNA-binding transcriptional regulator YafY
VDADPVEQERPSLVNRHTRWCDDIDSAEYRVDVDDGRLVQVSGAQVKLECPEQDSDVGSPELRSFADDPLASQPDELAKLILMR